MKNAFSASDCGISGLPSSHCFPCLPPPPPPLWSMVWVLRTRIYGTIYTPELGSQAASGSYATTQQQGGSHQARDTKNYLLANDSRYTESQIKYCILYILPTFNSVCLGTVQMRLLG